MSEENRPEPPETGAGANEPAGVTGVPATVPDSKLTIKANRLAGSAHCLNCGTRLEGPFCHYCGQPDKNLVRFFPALLREMMEDFVDFDSRFMRTMKPLLFRPGRLTRDYLDGRRFRYVPPLRLYIFSSILMFFLLAVIAGSELELTTQAATDGPAIQISMDDEEREDLAEAMAELDKVQPGLGEQVGAQIEAAESGQDVSEDEIPDKISFDVNGQPWDPETNPVVIPLMPKWVDRWINSELEESPQKLKELGDDAGAVIAEQALDVLPGTMFVLLPLVAALFKFWYLFARRYYVEHLIFALHNHAFIFITMLILMLAGQLTEWREPGGEGPVTTAYSALQTGILIWIPIYLFLSLKRVYQQGWWLTTAKFTAIGFSYAMLLSFASAFVGLLSIVLL